MPPAVVGEPVDTHGEDFTVFALDVEDVRVAVIEQESLLSFRLGLDEARDVFERRKVLVRELLPDVLVVSVRFEGGRHVGTRRGAFQNRSRFDIEAVAERIPDVEPGTGLVELGRTEGLRPRRNGGGCNGLEEPRFVEHRIALRDATERVHHRLFDICFELVPALDGKLAGVFVELGQDLFQCGLNGARGEVFQELLELALLVFRDRLSRHRTFLFSR